jgi:WD40 repeat protein
MKHSLRRLLLLFTLTISLSQMFAAEPAATADTIAPPIRYLQWHPRENTIAFLGENNSLILRNIYTGGELEVASDCQCFALSPDGTKIAYTTTANNVHLYCLSVGRITKTISGHEHTITAITWKPDGKVLSSGDKYGNVYDWNIENGKLIKKRKSPYSKAITFLSWGPQGNILLLSESDNSVSTSRSESSERCAWYSSESPIRCAGWDASEKIVTLQKKNENIVVLYLEENKVEEFPAYPNPQCKFFVANAQGTLFAFFAPDNTISICSRKDGSVIKTFSTYYPITGLAWNPRGDILAWTDFKGNINLHKEETPEKENPGSPRKRRRLSSTAHETLKDSLENLTSFPLDPSQIEFVDKETVVKACNEL